jgi:glycosyltransferase involved in cell wall biosynthesis
MITVCQALKDALVELGAPAEKITVLRNGVDLELFHPEDRGQARARYGISGFALASVGNLIPTKGHQLVIEALRSLPDLELLIAGRGPNGKEFRELAQRLGVADRVKFLGLLSQEELKWLYSAADALVLASVREGWPNVLLEAMACGTPVVTTNVGGIREIVAAPEAGVLMDERSANGIVRAIGRLRSGMPSRNLTRAYAERFGWQPTSDGQLALFRQILTQR